MRALGFGGGQKAKPYNQTEKTLIDRWLCCRADQSYWQSAVAATPAAAWKGYLLGALLWFSVPFTLSTGAALFLMLAASSLPVHAPSMLGWACLACPVCLH